MHTCSMYNRVSHTQVTVKIFSVQKHPFKAEDLVEERHLGDGAFGTVSKMIYPPTDTPMAVKVSSYYELLYTLTNMGPTLFSSTVLKCTLYKGLSTANY